MYRGTDSGKAEYYLAHPGGPFFAGKDAGVWTVPKGLIEDDEDLLKAAQREFEEETGLTPSGPFVDLGTIEQKGGKVVHAWAFEAPVDFDPTAPVRSNTFRIEWPGGSGKQVEFPEVDRAGFFDYEAALQKILPAQRPFIENLAGRLKEED